MSIFAIDASDGAARAGTLSLPHGQVSTPVFMPVGTQGTVKALLPDQLERAGVEMLLGNTYHLHLRPGEDVVAGLGGLHDFMAWPGPILTDSGGFQVFSLAALRRMTDDGAEFRSHIDGSLLTLTPEKATAIQNTLGADVIMAFDECVPYPCERERAAHAVERTAAWAKRCQDAHARPGDQALFGIVQGSVYDDLRVESAQRTVDIGFPGYAIGGVSVGEGADLMYRAIDAAIPHLPWDAPHYVMGVGTPPNLLECIERGVDMFDCVMPSRNARGAGAFGPDGKLRLRNLQYREDGRPIDESCDCYACRNFSRAYLRHMYLVREITASVLVSIHNVAFYQRLVRQARQAIVDGTFQAFKKAFLDRYNAQEGTAS